MCFDCGEFDKYYEDFGFCFNMGGKLLKYFEYGDESCIINLCYKMLFLFDKIWDKEVIVRMGISGFLRV